MITASEFAKMAADGGAHTVELLKSTALVWLDLRDRLLADLSVEDGEWPETVPVNRLKEMNRLMKALGYHASSLAAGPEHNSVIWFILDEQARLHGYTIEVNWSIRIDEETP